MHMRISPKTSCRLRLVLRCGRIRYNGHNNDENNTNNMCSPVTLDHSSNDSNQDDHSNNHLWAP